MPLQRIFRAITPGLSSEDTRRIASENAAIEQQLIEAWRSLHRLNPIECARCVARYETSRV